MSAMLADVRGFRLAFNEELRGSGSGLRAWAAKTLNPSNLLSLD